MANRKKFADKMKEGKSLELQIDRKLFEFVFGSTGLKINFAKESLPRLTELKERMGPFVEDRENGKKQFTVSMPHYFKFLRELDSFVFELYGSLDFFSREIDLVLGLGLDERRCSFSRIKKVLENRTGDDDIKNAILEMWDSEWFRYFHALRNRLTHRIGLVLSSRNDEFFFPDDPLSPFPETNLKEMKLIPNCRLWLEKCLSYVDEISGFIGARVFSDW